MILYPKLYLNSVKDISLELLKQYGLKGLILDVDNTLIDYDKNMPEGISNWAENLKEKGILLCIVSNTNQKEKVEKVAKQLLIPYIYFAKKPCKGGLLRAKTLLGLENNEIAVVGDQILTDVLGANRCKMFSILVKPINEKDIFITKIKRPIEQKIIANYQKKKGEENVHK